MHASTPTTSVRARLWSILPWLIFVIGIPLSILLFNVIRGAIDDVAKLRFERQAADAAAVVEERIQFYSDILYGLRALFASQSPVNRLQFHRFVESLDLKKRFPGFDVVNYAIYVPGEDKEAFIESVRRDSSLDPRGYPQFEIRPPGTRMEYFVLAYVEPMAGFEFAFGRDLGANPDAADPQPLVVALQSARDSGELTASGVPIRIKARGKQYTGLAMRLAVYRSGEPVNTVMERRAAYLGSVGAGFNIEDLMRGVLDERTMQHSTLRVYDVRAATQPPSAASDAERRLLFDSEAGASVGIDSLEGVDRGPRFQHKLTIEVGGRLWEMHFDGLKHTIIGRIDQVLPAIVLATGFLVSFLLFGMFYSLASSRSRAVAIADGITRNLRESEKELRQSTEQLQALSRRLVDVQETERRQLARELHDRVGQNLTALSISLDILRTQIAGNGNEAFRMRLGDAASLLESTAGTIENVMTELRPPMLDDYGLLPALQWYASEFAARTGIAVRVNGDEPAPRLDAASEIALFRITQEALNNVAKHAHASSVEIRLERSGPKFILTIADNGQGFAADSSQSPRRRTGLGMVTMRERTQAVGGEFEIHPAHGRGTCLEVRVPG